MELEGIQPILSEEHFSEEEKITILDKKGFHLNETGAETYAKALEKGLTDSKKKTQKKRNAPKSQKNETPKKTTKNDKQYETQFMTQSETAGRIIGRNGAQVNQLQYKHKVKIATDRQGPETQITISGSEENVKKAKHEILTIIDTKKNKPKETPVCRYFLGKGCDFGEECRFQHPKDTKRKRTPEHSPERSPDQKYRKRNDSRNDNRRSSTNMFTYLE